MKCMKLNSFRLFQKDCLCKAFSVLLASVVCASMYAQTGRIEKNLSDGWKFCHQDAAANSSVAFDDSQWESVRVPHDWAISGPFDNNNDKQTVAIAQNGETIASEKTGRTGSLPWTGIGWYRTHFKVDKKAGRVILNFDGAMAEPEVFVNGVKCGEWKIGYNAFNVDVTSAVKRGKDNVLAVRLLNVPESSRWYPGAGIYRPVKLIQTQNVAIEEWGVNFETLGVVGNAADFRVSVDLAGNTLGRNLVLLTELMPVEMKSRSVDAVFQCEYAVAASGKTEMTAKMANVKLWSPENPALYKLVVGLYEVKGKKKVLLDKIERKVGFRTVSFTAENGFQLNGVTRKFRGVCLHHDLGMIGTAVNKAAMARQLLLLKTMGCDAIRTSHNMPSQMQMALCDSLGLMVMAESFDMWAYPKCKNGYNRFFKDWWSRDLTNLVLANRLHPSIVMWSVGNEIPEQGGKDGTQMLQEIQDLMHRLDSSRLCTTGMDRWDACVHSGFAAVIDIPGLNYRTHRYQYAHESLPQGFVLGTETASTISSRGVYHFPVKETKNEQNRDGQCSGYDLGCCSWSNIPEDDWVLQDDNDWVTGEFVWTGFDYLGEPTPYDDRLNARSSYFGIFDLAGLPKDRYWLYRSRWNAEKETIHILPHWTWPGREGEVTPVYVYTNYPKAELFVNGKSQGVRTKTKDGDRVDRYRLRWNEVKYEPGEVKVVVYDANGAKKGEKIMKTTGEASQLDIQLEQLDEYSSPASLKADGDDMLFFVVSMKDKDGNLVPDADNSVKVSVDGAAQFKGMCNGDATSFEVFTRPQMKLFHGQLVVGIQSNGRKGNVEVTVSSEGFADAKITVRAE